MQNDGLGGFGQGKWLIIFDVFALAPGGHEVLDLQSLHWNQRIFQ